jgi:DNA-binding transcriptional MerR regulator
MYTIKEAAARAGVTVPVMRAWERRYGIVEPNRTPSGYRLYDDAAIERVRTMRRLVDDGWVPSQAAREVIDRGPAAAALAAVAGSTEARSESALGYERGAASEPLIDAFVEAAATLDERAVGEILDAMFARGSFEAVASADLFPALRALGDAWAAGRVSVAGEHLASHAVLRRLGAALEATGHGRNGTGQVLVGLPPGSRHELGALGFAIAARRAGLPVAYVGPDLPVDDWLSATGDARAAVIGVVTTRDRSAATRVVERLREDRPGLLVALGGRAAPVVHGTLTLPTDLRAAVDELATALEQP